MQTLGPTFPATHPQPRLESTRAVLMLSTPAAWVLDMLAAWLKYGTRLKPMLVWAVVPRKALKATIQ